MDKEKFYEQMQPYFEQGLVREIYSSDHLCMLCFGELCYVACPYVFLDNAPFGVYVTHNSMRKLAQKNRLIYPYVNEVISDLSVGKNMFYDFPIDKIDVWKKWIADTRLTAKPKIDHQLEFELSGMSKRKSGR